MAETSEITDLLEKRGVIILEVRTGRKLDASAESRFLTSMYAFFAQKEREYISRRTKEGLVAAKARGVKICARTQPRFSKLDTGAETWLRMVAEGKSYREIGAAAMADLKRRAVNSQCEQVPE
jgi:DNA invertase Pin-like site-specific DNA recombinase